jgi:hypothetical protein
MERVINKNLTDLAKEEKIYSYISFKKDWTVFLSNIL